MAVAINSNVIFMLVFEKVMAVYSINPETVPTDFLGMETQFVNLSRILISPNPTIFFIYVPAQEKMGFIWQDDL